MPDDVLSRIDATLEDWENGSDAARWHADGGPDDLAEWIAYCAPGHLHSAAFSVGLSGFAGVVTEVRETAVLEGSDVILVRTEPLELPPFPPLTFPRDPAADWRRDWLIGASINRPMSLLSGGGVTMPDDSAPQEGETALVNVAGQPTGLRNPGPPFCTWKPEVGMQKPPDMACPDCGHSDLVHIGVEHCPVCELVYQTTEHWRRREARRQGRPPINSGSRWP